MRKWRRYWLMRCLLRRSLIHLFLVSAAGLPVRMVSLRRNFLSILICRHWGMGVGVYRRSFLGWDFDSLSFDLDHFVELHEMVGYLLVTVFTCFFSLFDYRFKMAVFRVF